MALGPDVCPRAIVADKGYDSKTNQVAARRVTLQMIHNTIISAPDGLRDALRTMTRMQLVRTLAAWHPDLTRYRDLEAAYRTASASNPWDADISNSMTRSLIPT